MNLPSKNCGFLATLLCNQVKILAILLEVSVLKE